MSPPTRTSAGIPTSAGVPTSDEVLDRLDPEQRAVALALHGPVCVLAGAGTGKTRAITHRIAYGVHAGVLSPGQVLAVTFTARAAGEMRGRLRAAGRGGRPGQDLPLRGAAPADVLLAAGGGRPGPGPGRQQGAAGRRGGGSGPGACGRCRRARRGRRDRVGQGDAGGAGRLPRCRARAGRSAPGDLAPAEVARLYAAYEEVKRGKGQMDFEDVLLLTVAVLEDRADVAEEVRAQYRHLVVDEYQDVNPLQQALLDQWLGGRDDICVVGDAAQTIYSFAGASPEHLVSFASRYPYAQVVRLVRDYRSTPQVVGLANGLLRGSARARTDAVSAAGRPAGRAAPAGPGAHVHRLRRRDRRGCRGGCPGARAAWRPGPRPARSRCCTGSTRSPRCSRRRWPRPASRTSCAGRSASSTGPRCARRWCCCGVPPGRPGTHGLPARGRVGCQDGPPAGAGRAGPGGAGRARAGRRSHRPGPVRSGSAGSP